jgi:indolepyruvate ferredoxin oxidoreductase alpha subunit
MRQTILLGDESVALGAVHAGITTAYGYPGTPATEIMEYLLDHRAKHGTPHAAWCANEKTAYEEALGTAFAGRRALVTMKHVGLNVAADPFVNSALVEVHGGLVLAVADDPGMHSSQNEQDSRWYADFARVICLEPASQQEAYDMTVEAFDLSERFRVPVLLRLVTRLAHSRTVVNVGAARDENPIRRAPQRASWILLPANARRQWRGLIERQEQMLEWSGACRFNSLTLSDRGRGLGVITTGLARAYYLENLPDLDEAPSHLHIGAHPMPAGLIRRLAAHVKHILVIEDGYPLVERRLKGVFETPVEILGRLSGHLPPDGELDPDIVRSALGLPRREQLALEGFTLPRRPPQLCKGCPHAQSYLALKEVFGEVGDLMVTADIGCYTLGALPPYSAIESCVCMGASIGMAKGAAEAGVHPVVAVIGDSTFLHSGITPLLDAVAARANMTVLIMDNGTVGMTGAQETIVPSARLQQIVLGVGVDPEHFHVVEAARPRIHDNAAVLRREIDHKGVSVIVAVRDCLKVARAKARAAAAEVAP